MSDSAVAWRMHGCTFEFCLVGHDFHRADLHCRPRTLLNDVHVS